MTDKAAEKLKSSGWTQLDTTGFLSLVGPLWERVVDGEHEYALVAQHKHHNRRGLVQGGLLMTFADRACGMTARYVSGRPTLATIQLDVHFVDSGKIGEILLAKPRVVRATRSLIFTTTEVTAGNRCIIMASGVFKILKNEAETLSVIPRSKTNPESRIRVPLTRARNDGPIFAKDKPHAIPIPRPQRPEDFADLPRHHDVRRSGR